MSSVFQTLRLSLFSTQSNICDGACFADIVNSWYCRNQRQSSGVVRTNFGKFTRILVFKEAADLQSLTLSKKEILTQMVFCEFCEIFITLVLKNLRS